MAAWFIRVKHNYELADKGIVMIGFGIADEIIGKKTLPDVKDYLKNKGESGQSMNIRAGLINKFMNVVNIGDTIISPFDGGYLRIGKVISDCNTLESFYENREEELADILDEKSKNTKEPEEIKPARKVEWITDKLNKTELPYALREALNKTMRMTIHSLDIEDIENMHDSSASTDLMKIAINKFIDMKTAKNVEEKQVHEGQFQDATDDFTVAEKKETGDMWAIKNAITAAVTAVATAFATSFVAILNSNFKVLFAFVFFVFFIFVLYTSFNKSFRDRLFYAFNKFKYAFLSYEEIDKETK